MLGTWDSKDPLMAAYRWAVDNIAGHFKGYQVEHVDRRKNEQPMIEASWGLSVSLYQQMFFLIY